MTGSTVRRTAHEYSRRVLIALAAMYCAATAARIYERKYYLFVPDYVRWTFTPAPAVPKDRPTHIFFLMADHFEPGADPAATTSQWTQQYIPFASRHHDSSGRMFQHTWFYPGEQANPEALGVLRGLTERGFGEVELHFHHSHGTSTTLRRHLQWAIGVFQQFGFLQTIDGGTHFGFLHGNFALDNGGGGPGVDGDELCGVNDELSLLHEVGAFADYTFPSVYEYSQPPFVNAIYAAKDDPSPRSYRHRYPLADLRNGRADLMIFEGPLVFAPSWNMRRLFLDLDDGNIHAAKPAGPMRVDRWIRANIHVPAKPEWVFVKVFAHSVSTPSDQGEVIGPDFDSALRYLEERFDDGRRYVLHYVTAREAYNLAMAAADGRDGDPRQYFDYIVKPYVADGPAGSPASNSGR